MPVFSFEMLKLAAAVNSILYNMDASCYLLLCTGSEGIRYSMNACSLLMPVDAMLIDKSVVSVCACV